MNEDLRAEGAGGIIVFEFHPRPGVHRVNADLRAEEGARRPRSERRFKH